MARHEIFQALPTCFLLRLKTRLGLNQILSLALCIYLMTDSTLSMQILADLTGRPVCFRKFQKHKFLTLFQASLLTVSVN